MNRACRGYVLAVTLVLVAISALVMVGAARMSMSKALHALEARRSLQLRWGVISAQRVLLPLTDQVLTDESLRIGEAATSARREVTLGEVRFGLVFSDEQSKANVNSMLRHRGREETEHRVMQMLAETGLGNRAHFEVPTAEGEPTLLRSYGQFLEEATPEELLKVRAGSAPVDQLTLWGNGRINLQRASYGSLKAFCSPELTLTDIQKLLAVRRESASLSVAEFLDRLQLSSEVRQHVGDRMTVRSQCHSMWIIGYAGRRTSYRLAVRETGRAGPPQLYQFQW